MTESLEALLARIEELFAHLEEAPEPHRSDLFDLLDAIDDLHRSALVKLADHLGHDRVAHLAELEPALAWLFQAYRLLPPPRPSTPVEISPRKAR